MSFSVASSREISQRAEMTPATETPIAHQPSPSFRDTA
jgi:hypothetical protein